MVIVMPNYKITVEEGEVNVVHCEVYTWSLSTYKQLIEDVAFLKRKYNQFITASPNEKFCSMLGGRYTGKTLLHEGEEYKVMVWD